MGFFDIFKKKVASANKKIASHKSRARALDENPYASVMQTSDLHTQTSILHQSPGGAISVNY